jgi:phosphoribosylanthranilate isomerase
MAQIKICGNHHDQDILVLSSFKTSIDYCGFIFTCQSKRLVNPTQVREWIEAYPWLAPKAVAVFMNQTVEEISQVLKITNISLVQLHGTESPAFCQSLLQLHPDIHLWKTIPVKPYNRRDSDVQELSDHIEAYLPVVDVILLDTKLDHHPGGGTGKTFDWSVIPSLYQMIQACNRRAGRPVKLFVAGGISAQNVGELFAKTKLDGIDLASGAERDGYKDSEKIKAIVGEVKHSVNR